MSRPSATRIPDKATERRSIPAALEAAVAAHGDRPAVVDGERVLSYRDLHERVRRAAGALRPDPGAGPSVVAVLADHGIDQIVAILAVLEAGRSVVVLDAGDPADRQRELLREAEASAIIADPANHAAAVDLSGPRIRVVALDAASRDAAPTLPTAIPRPDDLAFILFTSGSTGKPKGVLATHGNIVLNVRNYAASVDLRPEDRMTLLSRCQFMAGLSATFGALLHGAALHPFDARRRGFREMHEWMTNGGITVYHSVPSLFRRFCESLPPETRFRSVRIVKLGGEQVMNHDVKLWRRHFPRTSILINGLGLSEANGNLCHFRIDHDSPPTFDVVPVGRPLPGVDLVLLDDSGHPVLPGESGEIAFRCPHRSPGYWRSDGFADRLIPPPPGIGGTESLFRTGDLGRILPDGCLQHLGRRDDLLKLRGLRIEPAQIEAALFEDPRVRQCAVGVRGEGSRPQQLVAWIVPTSGTDPTPEELRSHLEARLPAALVPSRFISLTEMPTTPGGKIDRKALPDRTAPARGRVHAASGARNVVEERLAKLWRKLLRVPAVGPSDDFFALGGDSLTAAVLLSKVEEMFDADIALGDFLAAPTLEATAKLVRSMSGMEIHRRLLLIRAGTLRDATPFFFIPGAGEALRTRIRGAASGPRPFYWLQYQGLDGVEAPQRTVPDMGVYFAEEIQRVQPRGPYLIGGGSFGALVALEAAHLLRARGEEVRLLVVVDSLLDGCLRPKLASKWRDRLERRLLWLMPVGRRFALTRTGIRDGITQWRHRAAAPLVRRWCRLRRRSVPKIHRGYDLLNHCVAAKRRYHPRRYEGKVALLRNRLQAADRLFELEPTLGWKQWCPNLQRHDLAGEKGEHNTDPRQLATYIALLDSLLDSALDAAPGSAHPDQPPGLD